MPFDGSGNYTPPGPPVFPEVSGTTISATYFNTLMNDVFAAMSKCLVVDGQSVVSGNISWNSKNLTGVNAFSCTTISINGSPFTPSSYLPLAGGTMTGALVISNAGDEKAQLLGTNPFIGFYNSTGVTRYGFVQATSTVTYLASDAGDIQLKAGGSTRVTISGSTGAATFTANLSARDIHADRGDGTGVIYFGSATTRYLYYDGSQYLMPSANLSVGGTVKGLALQVLDDTSGTLSLGRYSSGNPTSIIDCGSLATAFYVQMAGGNIKFAITSAGDASSNRDFTAGRNLSVTGTSALGTSASVNGNTVWHAGNLTGAALNTIYGYTPANKAGDTFTGTMNFGNDANFNLAMVSSNPTIQVGASAKARYDRTNSKWIFTIGGVDVMSVDASGNIRTIGDVKAFQASV